jgi:hypothetical protein
MSALVTVEREPAAMLVALRDQGGGLIRAGGYGTWFEYSLRRVGF